jgi:outer membrane immunogenic protein
MKLSSGILGLTLSSVVALASANAADMYAAPVGGGYKDWGPIETWAGFYAGVNGGYAWGTEVDLNGRECDGPRSCNISASGSGVGDGAFGGGQIGYNIQRDRLVFGLEADIQGAGVTASASAVPAANISANATSDLNFFGTVRGRLGLTFPDAAGLIYITSGLAYGGVQHKLTATASGASRFASDDQVEAGWVLGAGYERFVTPAISLKVEYQFIDLGSEQLQIPANNNTAASATYFDNFSTVRAGLNYHLGAIYQPLK